MMTPTGFATDRRITRDLTLEQVAAFTSDDQEHGFVWFYAVQPTADEIDAIGERCRIDPSVIRETARHHARPILQHPGPHLLLVVSGLQVTDRTGDAAELRIIASDRCLATIQKSAIDAAATVHAGMYEPWPRRQSARVGELLYAILEAIVDR